MGGRTPSEIYDDFRDLSLRSRDGSLTDREYDAAMAVLDNEMLTAHPQSLRCAAAKLLYLAEIIQYCEPRAEIIEALDSVALYYKSAFDHPSREMASANGTTHVSDPQSGKND